MVQESWIADPLGLMIGPAPQPLFFEGHYGRAPLLCQRRDPDRFSPLLSLAELDRLLDTADLREGSVGLVRAGRMIATNSYVGQSGRVIPSAVAEEYLNGATIIFQHLQDGFGPLGTFCRALEALFSAHIQTNIYLTPSGAQGFAPHADAHDVFILQVAGSKTWRLHGHEPGDFTLRPGDSVYIPSGQSHEAWSSGAAPSLHITVGLITKSWADLLAAALGELSEREPLLRRPLPPGHARADFERAPVLEELAALASRLAEPAAGEAALDRLNEDWLRERRPRVAGVLAAVPDRAATRYRARPLTPWRLRSDAHDVILIGPGGDLRFAARDQAALQRALSGEAFAPADLPGDDPDRLVRKLWANGYIEVAL